MGDFSAIKKSPERVIAMRDSTVYFSSGHLIKMVHAIAMEHPGWLVLLLFWLGSFSACRDARPLLSWGEGGGFTGMWQGYTVYTDGTVERWAQLPGQDRQRHHQGKLTPAQQQAFSRIYQQIQTLQPHTNPANYNRFLTCYTPQDTLHWTWGVADTQAIALSLQHIYLTLNQQLQQP